MQKSWKNPVKEYAATNRPPSYPPPNRRVIRSPASELGQYKNNRLDSQGLEENGVGGGRHTIKTGSATQKILKPGALMTSRRCCAGLLQADVTLCEGKLQGLHVSSQGRGCRADSGFHESDPLPPATVPAVTFSFTSAVYS